MPTTRRGVSIGRVWLWSTVTLLFLTVIVAVLMHAQRMRILAALDRDDERAIMLQHSVDGRLNALLSQEAGLRGFLATGDEAFLEPYHAGRSDEERLRRQLILGELAPEDRDELAQALALEERAARRWHDEIAAPQLAARRASAAVDVRALFDAGRQRFDAYRAAHGTLRQALERANVNGERRERTHWSHANEVAGALLIFIVLVGVFISRAILQRTIAPLTALCDAAERGHVSVDAVASTSVREVLVLARTLEQLFRAVEDRAMRDGLTRVYNRAYLAEWLPRQLRAARRAGSPLAALMVDVDYFKRINDTRGHAAGDQVLIALARCIDRELRASDVVVRYGGEEFTVILPDTPVAGAFVTAERLRAAIAAMTDRDGLPAGLRISASIGLAAVLKGDDGAQLLPRADAALYLAKRGGRNRVVAAPPVPRALALVERERLAG
jgi:diguanylate cyclase (GGDEF)-like protein